MGWMVYLYNIHICLHLKEQWYTWWYPVRVYFPANNIYNAFIHEDEIKGESPEGALRNAYWNWEDALKIELLDESEE